MPAHTNRMQLELIPERKGGKERNSKGGRNCERKLSGEEGKAIERQEREQFFSV